MKIRGCNCWQWPGLTGGKELFCPLPCSTAGHVAIGHPIHIVNVPHVTVIIRHNCRLYRIPRVHRNNCLLWVDRECLPGGTHLSCPSTLQPSSHPWSLLECHHVSVIVSWVWGPWACPFCAVSQSHNMKFFSGPSHQTGQGRKRSCPCTVYGLILLPPLSDSHCSVGCCQVLCCPLSVLTKVTFMSYVYPVESHSMNILMLKHLRFFGMYCLNNTLPLNFTMTSSTAKCSEGL